MLITNQVLQMFSCLDLTHKWKKTWRLFGEIEKGKHALLELEGSENWTLWHSTCCAFRFMIPGTNPRLKLRRAWPISPMHLEITLELSDSPIWWTKIYMRALYMLWYDECKLKAVNDIIYQQEMNDFNKNEWSVI